MKKKKKTNAHGGARAGAGRKKTYGARLVTFSVSMPLDMAQWVADQAEKQTAETGEIVSRSRVVTACCQHFMGQASGPQVK